MSDIILCVVLVYCIVLWIFTLSDVLTGCQFYWLDKTTEVLIGVGLGLLTMLVIFSLIACVYGIATKDPNFVGVTE